MAEFITKIRTVSGDKQIDYDGLANKPSAVLYTAQDLTDEQKAQARANIGAGTGEPVATVEPAPNDIPCIFVSGNTLPANKSDGEIIFKYVYVSKTKEKQGYCTLKVQGNTSTAYPKKNFTIKFYHDAQCTDKDKTNINGWGKQSKFVLKANYIDHTHARNIINANIWADMVRARADYDELPEGLTTSPNLGVIDGIPAKLYVNGTYYGIYTLNIPKDKWMANMDDDLDTNCILGGEDYYSGCFRGAWNGISGSGWSDEVHDTVPDTIITRWNEVIDFVMNSSDAQFKANLDGYIDVRSAIDYFLLGIYITNLDGFGKNQLYLTYDGLKWYANPYDMDATWGLWWNGGGFVATDYPRSSYQDIIDGGYGGNLLYNRMQELFVEEIKARHAELRASVINESNIFTKFEWFMNRIGVELYVEDGEIWTSIPLKNTNNIKQVRNYVRDRLAYADTFINSLVMPVPCTALTLDQSAISISGVGTQTLTATKTPADTTDVLTWASSNTSVATVANGVITSIANGNANITATCGTQTATCTVTVSGIAEPVPCTALYLNKDATTLNVDDTETLVATVTPTDTTDALTWQSNNTSVATVENGVVTAHAIGSATITATCGTQTAACYISVEQQTGRGILGGVTWSRGYIDGQTGVPTPNLFDVYTSMIELANYPYLVVRTSESRDNSRVGIYTESDVTSRVYTFSKEVAVTRGDATNYMRMSIHAATGESPMGLYAYAPGESVFADRTSEVVGKYYEINDGSLKTYASRSSAIVTIPDGVTEVIIRGLVCVVAFDSNGNFITAGKFIGESNSALTTYTLPAGTAKLGMSWLTADVANAYIGFDTDMTEVGYTLYQPQ